MSVRYCTTPRTCRRNGTYTHRIATLNYDNELLRGRDFYLLSLFVRVFVKKLAKMTSDRFMWSGRAVTAVCGSDIGLIKVKAKEMSRV